MAVSKKGTLILVLIVVVVAVIAAELVVRSSARRANREPPQGTEQTEAPRETRPGDPASSSPSWTDLRSSGKWSTETEATVQELVRKACSLDRGTREKASRELVEMGPDAVPYLARLLETKRNPAEVKAIIEILVQMDDPDAWEIVRDAMYNTDKANRQDIVARGIVDGAGPGMEDKITDLIEGEPEIAQRLHAGRRLGELGGEGAVTDWVDRYYETDDEARRSQYVEALSHVTDPGVIPELEHVVTTNPDDDLARSAAYGLARIGTRDSADVIVNEMRQTSDDGRLAFLSAALGNIRDRRVLAAYRQDESETVRQAVEEALDEEKREDEPAAPPEDNTDDEGDDGGGTDKPQGRRDGPVAPVD